MAIRFPSAAEVVDALKNNPTALLSGTVMGIAVGGFIGWTSASSGVASKDAQLQLLAERRDAIQAELLAATQERDGHAQTIESLKDQLAARQESQSRSTSAWEEELEALRERVQQTAAELLNTQRVLSAETAAKRVEIGRQRAEILSLREENESRQTRLELLEAVVDRLGINYSDEITAKMQKLNELVVRNSANSSRITHLDWDGDTCDLEASVTGTVSSAVSIPPTILEGGVATCRLALADLMRDSQVGLRSGPTTIEITFGNTDHQCPSYTKRKLHEPYQDAVYLEFPVAKDAALGLEILSSIRKPGYCN